MPTASAPQVVVFNDFNNDGFDEIVVTNFISNTIIIYENDNGTIIGKIFHVFCFSFFFFSGTQSLATGASPLGVCGGDFNGDGNNDIVVANFGSNSISFYAGNGTNAFDAPLSFVVGTNPTIVSKSDLNGDGVDDVGMTFGCRFFFVLLVAFVVIFLIHFQKSFQTSTERVLVFFFRMELVDLLFFKMLLIMRLETIPTL